MAWRGQWVGGWEGGDNPNANVLLDGVGATGAVGSMAVTAVSGASGGTWRIISIPARARPKGLAARSEVGKPYIVGGASVAVALPTVRGFASSGKVYASADVYVKPVRIAAVNARAIIVGHKAVPAIGTPSIYCGASASMFGQRAKIHAGSLAVGIGYDEELEEVLLLLMAA